MARKKAVKKKENPPRRSGGNSNPPRDKKGKGLAKKVLGAAATLPVLIPLQIFKAVMKKALEKKGIKPEKELKDLVVQFHDEIVKRSSLEEDLAPVAAAGLQGIVTAILSFFKKLKEKKEKQESEIAAGKTPSDPMTKGEEVMLENAEKAVETGKQYAKDEATFQFGKYAPWIIGGLIGLFLLYHFMK